MEPPTGVIRCTLTKVHEDDWRWTTIFHTFIKIGNHVRKIILDNGSCVNVVSPNTVNLLGLHITPHPNSYRVSWIDATSFSVSTRCLVPITFTFYHDKVWCDIILMKVWNMVVRRQASSWTWVRMYRITPKGFSWLHSSYSSSQSWEAWWTSIIPAFSSWGGPLVGKGWAGFSSHYVQKGICWSSLRWLHSHHRSKVFLVGCYLLPLV